MKGFKEWLIEDGKSENTIRSYLKVVSYFESWYEKNFNEVVDYQNIRPVDLREWKQYLLKAQKKNNEPLAIRTINNYIESMKTYFRYLEETKIITHNPSLGLKPQTTRIEYVPRWLEPREKRSLLREIEDPVLENRNPWLYYRNRVIVYLSLHGGLRISEKVNLSIYDFTKGYISIREGKGQVAREVPMNKALSNAVALWLKERNKKNPSTNYFLVSQKGGRLTNSGIYSLFNKLEQNTGIEDLTPHTLRHTFAHDLIEEGIPITYVAALLGHSDLDTTRLYTSAKKEGLKNAVNKLSDE